VKGDVSLHLSHDLVDVSVQHRHRSEPAQVRKGACPVLSPPSPRRVHGPERDVGEDNERGAAREPSHVIASASATEASLIFCYIGVGNTADAQTVWLDQAR
jgi:hypothetical protein